MNAEYTAMGQVMYKQNNNLYFSPSDITTFMDSPFASWISRFSMECPDKAPAPDKEEGLNASLQQKGYQRENLLLDQFKEQKLTIARITEETLGKDASWESRYTATLAAMTEGIDIIYQAALCAEQWRGFADFLVKKAGKSNFGDYYYEVWDTKLASSVKPKFVIQLCCYAGMLEAMQGALPEFIVIALGDNKQEVLRTRDYYFYYQAVKSHFGEYQDAFNENEMPDPADSKSYGKWTTFVESLLKEKDHLSLVANITRSQIKKLNKAGITTTQELANPGLGRVPGIRAEQLQKLQKQADIQLRTNGQIPPLYEIMQDDTELPAGLQLLPPQSINDVFFDIEGFPLEEGGLEYLWGSTYFDESGERKFLDFWAHNQDQEKRAFVDFINWVYARWQQDPSMHIYHYANYEIAACKRLMGRYGVCENEVDELLRHEVFVDF